jgi:hypothetical protein
VRVGLERRRHPARRSEALAAGDDRARPRRETSQLGHQPGLADPGIAHDDRQPRSPSHRARPRPAQPLELLDTADESDLRGARAR